MRALGDVLRQMFEDGWREGLRKCAQALPMLLNIDVHRQYTRVIRRPGISALLTRYPRLIFKYLGNSLSLDFSTRTRLKISIDHYEYLDACVRPDFFAKLFDHPQTLWESRVDDHRYSIELTFPHPDDQEGDLALTFLSNGFPLYMTSFAIGSGAVLGMPVDSALFIARMQGGGERYQLIKEATQACDDISPADLLMAALHAVAQTLGVPALVGVGSADQVSLLDDKKRRPVFNYDGFWLSYGAEISPRKLYLMRLPFLEKPLDSVKSKHRARTARKREFKRLLMAQVQTHCEENFLKTRPVR